MDEHLSQEKSQRLDELGVVVECNQSWYKDDTGYICLHLNVTMEDDKYICPAPTFLELWKVMPRYLKDGGRFKSELKMRKRGQAMVVGYQKMAEEYDVFEGTPVEALGDLCIWLAENNHLGGG